MAVLALLLICVCGVQLGYGQSVQDIVACEYNGEQYFQGDKWTPSCDRVCWCESATLNITMCNSTCQQYITPEGCQLEKKDGKCCPEPKCPWHTGCRYKGQTYTKNQNWKDGCRYSCTCVDDATGQIKCFDKCNEYKESLGSGCKVVQRPGECCPEVQCGNVTKNATAVEIPQITWANKRCVDVLDNCPIYDQSKICKVQWGRENCAQTCGFCVTTDLPDSGAVANGDGHPCVFPFIFYGKPFNKCLADGADHPWCATTDNYDTGKKWAYCHPRLCQSRCSDDSDCSGVTGRDSCVGQYLSWGRRNCARTCGYCERPAGFSPRTTTAPSVEGNSGSGSGDQ